VAFINGEKKEVHGIEAHNILNAFQRLYTTETEDTLELEIRLKTCSVRYGQSMNFTVSTFIETLQGLWDARFKDEQSEVLSRELIRRKSETKGITIRRRDPIKLSKNGKMESAGESVIESKNKRFTIDSDEDSAFILENYGYLPRLAISSEVPIEDENIAFDSIHSSIRVTFLLNKNWRVDASVRYNHIIYDTKALEREIIGFMWAPFIRDIKSPADFIQAISNNRNAFTDLKASDYDIEIEYLPPSAPNLPIIADIDTALDIVIRHGYKKREALRRIGSVTQLRKKEILWKYLQPIIKAYNPSRENTLRRSVQNKTIVFGQLVSAPKAIGINVLGEVYANLDKVPYALAWKLDGERAVIVLELSKEQLDIKTFGADFLNEYTVHITTPVPPKFLPTDKTITILDSEQFEGEYYIFDVLQFVGEIVATKILPTRLAKLETNAYKFLHKYATQAGIQLHIKPHIPLTKENFSKEAMRLFTAEKDGLRYDGLILTPIEGVYYSQRIYKIKPPLENTVDFLLMAIEVETLASMGINPRGIVKAYVAYVSYTYNFAKTGIRPIIRRNPWWSIHFPNLSTPRDGNTERIPVPFATAICWTSHLVMLTEVPEVDYHRKIVECSWVVDKNMKYPTDGKWVPYRIRADKTFEFETGTSVYGNHYNTAFSMLQSLYNPITPDMIKDPSKLTKSYFSAIDPAALEPYKDFLDANRIGKAIIYEDVIAPNIVDNTLIELGAGRGSDLMRAFFAGAINLFAIDSDENALLEFEGRAQQWIHNIRSETALANLISGKRHIPDPVQFNLRLINYKLGEEPNEKLLESILIDPNFPKSNVGAISMQFAIHYLFGEQEHFGRLYALCNRLLRKGGIFVFTYFDGEEIFNMIRNPSERKGVYSIDDKGSIKYFHDSRSAKRGKIKYQITAKYDITKTKMDNFGMKIGVYLPTIRQEMYDEYLVSRRIIKSMFRGYRCVRDEKLIENPYFSPLFSKIRKQPALSAQELISDVDMIYLSLIRVMVLQKK